MNAAGGMVAKGRVDREGALLAADPAIAALNERAGGGTGRPLAVPQLATIARLSWRLGIPVSRGVVVADDEGDLDLWVRAEPDGDEVRLAVSGWRDVPAWRPMANGDAAFADADWRWETDASLRLTSFVPDTAGLLGQPLSAAFAPGEGDADAFLAREAFGDRPARVRATGRAVVMSAKPRHDGAGAFAGFTGAAWLIDMPAPPSEPALPARFTSGLDRALRRPLARIVANADSMSAQADGPIAPAYADYASDIAGAGRHLLGLIDDLVDLEAIERADFVPATEPIDMADVARRAAGLLRVRATEAGVTVERPEVGAAPALGDFRRALQIAVNLLGNAIRYSPEGATVRVEVRREAGCALLIVDDQGKGIAPADQARIFDKFVRVDPSDDGGSGLGLYIARRLARAMGGDLSVESAPGAGSRFTFSLAAAA